LHVFASFDGRTGIVKCIHAFQCQTLDHGLPPRPRADINNQRIANDKRRSALTSTGTPDM
jgi:hypothetical protein